MPEQKREDDSDDLVAASESITPAVSATRPPDSGSPRLAPEHERLWEQYLEELRRDQDWDHDFVPSPYSPGRALRAFVERAGAAAAPTLLGAVSSEDESMTYWACVGLGWLGPRAGAAAAAALEARVWRTRGKAEPYWPAAVALEAVDPPRSRAAGAQRNPTLLKHLLRFHLERGIEAACEFIEWIIDHEDAATIEAMLRQWELRDAAVERCPSRLAERLRQLVQSHAADGVGAAAANLLAEARVVEPASKLIEVLARSGSVNTGAVERLAAHPDSEQLLNPILAQGNVHLLSELLLRRRCAGWQTDAWLTRALLREKLERPDRRWPTEQHEVHEAALCVAELRDMKLLDGLVKAVTPENDGYAWNALVRALRAFGLPALEALRRELAACPPGERRKRLEWMLARVEPPKPSMRELLDRADEIFLGGRIEPTVWGAFRAYGDVLLAWPSAHAAFQLAWIDRAFGAEVVPERVSWIRGLGFFEEELLAELARPLDRPLEGYRFEWDGGELQKHDPVRAARAAEAGLPSLAAHWSREVRYENAALAYMERVWQAVVPRLIAISDCEICRGLDEKETSFTKIGREEEATTLPPEANRLLGHEVRRCPICGTFYNYRTYYEFLIGGSEDEEKLTRLTPTQAKGLLTVGDYEALLRWMPGNLTHPEAKTRHYAAKCMVSHHLERGENASVIPFLTHSDPDIVLGALVYLWGKVDSGENMAELWEMRDVFGGLVSSPIELVANYARSIGIRLTRYARRAGLID